VEYERKNRKKDQKYARRSIFALIAAVALIAIALIILSLECGNLSIDPNSSEEIGPLVIVVNQFPNSSNNSYSCNSAGLNLNQSIPTKVLFNP
jgi:hypothetical protein